MIDTLFDIPYKIIKENIEYDEEFKIVTIHRTYKIPKSLFKSPKHHFKKIIKYDKNVIIKDGFKVFVYAGGWGDAECRSYSMIIIIAKVEGYA